MWYIVIASAMELEVPEFQISWRALFNCNAYWFVAKSRRNSIKADFEWVARFASIAASEFNLRSILQLSMGVSFRLKRLPKIVLK